MYIKIIVCVTGAKPFKSILLLIQHHILGISDKQTDTTPVIELVTSLKRMDITF